MNLPRPTPSMAVASTALLIALGGTGYAAAKLPRNSVDSAAIKRGAVGSSEVRNGSLTARDLAPGLVPGQVSDGLRGARGARGPGGPQGERGPQGPPGHDATGPRI